ncbi:hypothetical protein FQR65_LT06356 [Abscondita terminalis]|nr:hypothetical protein FQR65_LT06356 [Abscondita terminalis]
MFKRKLSALQYPQADSVSGKDETEFRKVIAWLEENKIKKYKVESSTITDIKSSNWKKSFEQYKKDLCCPVNDNILIELDWFINFALQTEYLQNKSKYEKRTIEATKSLDTPNIVADNPLDRLDFGGKDFENGVQEIARMLKITPHPNSLITLRAISKLICNRLNNNALKNPQDYVIKGTPFPFEEAIKGYDLGDVVLNKAAKIHRLLYIQDLRDLQTKLNELIVSVQGITANPKTDTKLGKNLPSGPTVLDETFNIKKFKKTFRIVIVRYESLEMEFDMIGTHPFIANTFRRLMLSDVPSIAIEKVHIYNNTSIIQDEVLAHRLGLIPSKADPRMFHFKQEDAEDTDQDTLEFELKIKCTRSKDENKDSSRIDDIYKNSNVYSKQIKWIPKGSQSDTFKESDVGPVHDDILIAKLRPGHELDLKLLAVKGIGRDHAKFSPVATAFYRLLPDIRLTREVEDEAAERLQSCFSPGVIGLRHIKNGKKVAVVNNSRYDTNSRNVFRHEDLKDAVVMTKIEDHFIFNIESVGAMSPVVIFTEAVKILKDKCLSLLNELEQI